MDDRIFDAYLKNRHTPEAPSNLSARIIEASCHTSQDAPLEGVKRWLRGFMEGFILPQPAFALAVLLIFGTSFVLTASGISFWPGIGAEDLSVAFEVGEYWDARDLL